MAGGSVATPALLLGAAIPDVGTPTPRFEFRVRPHGFFRAGGVNPRFSHSLFWMNFNQPNRLVPEPTLRRKGNKFINLFIKIYEFTIYILFG